MGFAAGRSWTGVCLLAMAGICVLDVSDAFVHGPASLRPLARASSSFMAGAGAGANTRMKLGRSPFLSSPAAGRRSMLPLVTMQQQKGPGSDGDADKNPTTGTNFVDLGESAQKRFKGIDGLESPLTDPVSISKDVTPLAGLVLGAGGAVAASAVIPGLPATLPLVRYSTASLLTPQPTPSPTHRQSACVRACVSFPNDSHGRSFPPLPLKPLPFLKPLPSSSVTWLARPSGDSSAASPNVTEA